MGRGERKRERGGTNMYRDIHRLADIQTKRHRKRKAKGDRQKDAERERLRGRETRRDKEKASKSLTLHCANRDVWMGKRNVRFQSDLVTHLKLSNKLF